MKATLKERLDVEFRPYVILGACNPPLANRALNADALAGLLLPCSVVIEADGDGSRVLIANPELLLTLPPLDKNPEVLAAASEAKARLQRVAAALAV